jgi:uncharacterized protein YceH (UPF0502 family)
MEVLSTEEARVLGCLIEKAATTPDAYPLTMNSLILACNQTSNRTPVVRFDEATVNDALLQLRERKLVRLVHSAHGSRVPKHRHALSEVWAITDAELAILAVLLLRGPQTINELRTRTERYPADIDDLGGVAGVLDRLAARDEPLAACLGRQPGQREERWVQLLADEPAWEPGPADADADAAPAQPWRAPAPPAASRSWPPPAAREGGDSLADEVRRLRRDVDELRDEVDRLLGRT